MYPRSNAQRQPLEPRVGLTDWRRRAMTSDYSKQAYSAYEQSQGQQNQNNQGGQFNVRPCPVTVKH
jgi:hypothetical protein